MNPRIPVSTEVSTTAVEAEKPDQKHQRWRCMSPFGFGYRYTNQVALAKVYFYTLTAGDFTAARKMLIRK